jgi:hypothetical protein
MELRMDLDAIQEDDGDGYKYDKLWQQIWRSGGRWRWRGERRRRYGQRRRPCGNPKIKRNAMRTPDSIDMSSYTCCLYVLNQCNVSD